MSRPPEPTAAMPRMMYGTAWKKERTADLVYEAIKAGFRGIDTAAMKRHYDEALAGEGIRRAIREGIVARKDLFIQTKFTPHDDSLPPSVQAAPIPEQVHHSLAASLANLSPTTGTGTGTVTDGDSSSYLDAVVLHAPYPSAHDTRAAWAALQSYLPSSSSADPSPSPRAGKVLRLGISNVTLPVLDDLVLSSPAAPPTIVQNRFRAAERAWDRDVRAWCARRGAAYQGFWTLTGNPAVWRPGVPGAGGPQRFVSALAEGAGVSRAAAWYALLMADGIVVLNGTSDVGGHMREDLEAWGKVQAWRATPEGQEGWRRCWDEYKRLVDG